MSAEVMAMLARRWHCSVADVCDRISAKLKVAGLIDEVTEAHPYKGESYQLKLTLGVTIDDHVAVLDEDDNVLMWLD